MSVRNAAKYLHKSREFVNKWVQRYKETNCVDDLPDRGSKRATTKRDDKAILQLFSKNPTLSLRKAQAMLAKKGIKMGIVTIKRRLEENKVAWRSTLSMPNSNQLVGPYFLPDRLTSTEFLNFLKNELSYLLEDVPLYSVQRMWMQLDGCPAHYGPQVRQWLNNRFPQRWIGRGGSISWPPRSPDLTPLDFYLWGTLKDKVYQTRINSRHELIQKINNALNEMKENRNEIRTVTNSIFDRCQSCIVNNGRHFEI
ncbi:hypothetical protein ANTRET_LOCUS2226 [Anthophora retusa]